MEVARAQRFQEHLRRLGEAPPASTATEARSLVERLLIEVEDELSGVPNDPTQWRNDGRMYPIQDDNWDLAGEPWVCEARRHLVLIGRNGAIRIEHRRTGAVVLSKPGADGEELP